MADWIELNEKQIRAKAASEGEAFAVFFYAPFCGTCKWAERMLMIVLEMRPALNLFKANLYYMPDLIREWKIESAPCLILVARNAVVKKEYAMRSVGHLYEWLKPLDLDWQSSRKGE